MKYHTLSIGAVVSICDHFVVMVVDHVPGALAPGCRIRPDCGGHQILGVRTGNSATTAIETLHRYKVDFVLKNNKTFLHLRFGPVMLRPQQMRDLMGDQFAGHRVVHHLPLTVPVAQPQCCRGYRGSRRLRGF